MREIELKFRVQDNAKLKDKLKILNCDFSEVIEQNDTVYVENLDSIESVEGSIWLRVRKENGHTELNLKKQSSNLEESREIEFGVDDCEKAKSFLETLGYKKWVEVNKKRVYSKYQNYNLCIDEVERLGSFIEIELLVEENDERDYIEELKSVAIELGLNKDDIIRSHYDTMINELDK